MMKQGSNKAIILAEYRFLNALIRKEEYWNDPKVNENLLTSEVAKSIFTAISNLKEKNVEITPQSLLQAGLEIDFNVSEPVINSIYEVDNSGASSLDDIIDTLNKATKKNKIISQLDELRTSVNNSLELDSNKILNEINDITDEILNDNKSTLINLDEWTDIYLQELEERKGATRYSYGDPLLDKTIYKSCYPGIITSICANTGAGKSSFVLYLINGMIEQNVPCMYLSLEMGAIDTFDRLISMRKGIPGEELYKTENIDSIREAVLEEKKIFETRHKVLFDDAPDIDLVSLRSRIKEFKQRTNADYGVVVIDLLTMIKEFASITKGASYANMIEMGMNKLNAIAKDENVHIIGTAQLGRENEKIRIHTVEELDDMRPRLTDIKNSNAIAERARVVLTLHRPKYFADKYLVPIEAPGAEDLEDIIELQVLKNNNGSSGNILKYMFDAPLAKITPIVEENAIDQLVQDNDFDF